MLHTNKLINLLEHAISLLIVFLLLAGTVVWTGQLLGVEIGAGPQKAHLSDRSLLPDQEVISRLGLAKDVSLQPNDSASWVVKSAEGDNIGLLVATQPYAAKVTGFAGATPLYLLFSADTLKALASGENAETPDYYAEAEEHLFRQVVGKTFEQINPSKLDALSGATMSSNGIKETLRLTLAARSDTFTADRDTPGIRWGLTLVVVVALALGAMAAWSDKRHKAMRVAVLLLNVGVLGFWAGQTLSVSLLRGWISHGLDPLLYLPLVIVLLVAIVMPILGRRHYYCNWVCPYGALQELAWLLPVPKVKVSQSVFNAMRMVRMVVLMALLACLWFGAGAWLLDYEPFALFSLHTAGIGVIVLALVFVVAGLFIPRPWCRCLCPLGLLLEMSEGGHKTPPAGSHHVAPKADVNQPASHDNPSQQP
ncbi:MAG: 4Fe-4S binding protein [Alloprevotella sp.]